MSSPWRSVDFKDLEIKGYVVLRNMIRPDEINLMLGQYLKAAVGNSRNYAVPHMDGEGLRKCKESFIDEILSGVGTSSDIKVDTLDTCEFFATEKGINFGWHSDHEAFFLTNDAYNYLNVYIPIRKPDPRKSNISLLPFDRLAKRATDLPFAFKGRGAVRAVPHPGRTIFVDDVSGQSFVVPADIDELALTPELAVGDVLLMRGDILHKTQDNETDRVSASLRLSWSQVPVTREQFRKTCMRKAVMMGLNPDYLNHERVFDLAQKNTLNRQEYQTLLGQARKMSAINPYDYQNRVLQNIGEVLKGMSRGLVILVEETDQKDDCRHALELAQSTQACLVGIQGDFWGTKETAEKYPTVELVSIANMRAALTLMRQNGMSVVGIPCPLAEAHNLSIPVGDKVAIVFPGRSGKLTTLTEQIRSQVA